MKKHIITLGGMLGSGKSSTARLLAERLQYTHYSAGDVMRQLGKEQGIEDIRAFGSSIVGKREFDHQVDQRTKLIGETEDRVVLDGHIASHFIPQSFRVFLTLDELTAAERIMSGMTPERRASEDIPDNAEEYSEYLKERKAKNTQRYLDLYEVNPYSPELYDLVVDTGRYSLEEVADKIIAGYQEWLDSDNNES